MWPGRATANRDSSGSSEALPACLLCCPTHPDAPGSPDVRSGPATRACLAGRPLRGCHVRRTLHPRRVVRPRRRPDRRRRTPIGLVAQHGQVPRSRTQRRREARAPVVAPRPAMLRDEVDVSVERVAVVVAEVPGREPEELVRARDDASRATHDRHEHEPRRGPSLTRPRTRVDEAAGMISQQFGPFVAPRRHSTVDPHDIDHRLVGTHRHGRAARRARRPHSAGRGPAPPRASRRVRGRPRARSASCATPSQERGSRPRAFPQAPSLWMTAAADVLRRAPSRCP